MEGLTKLVDRLRSQLAPRPQAREVCVLLQQLALMLQNGIPPGSALAALANQQSHPRLAEVLVGVEARIARQGWTISSALASYPDIFPPHTIVMVRAGEAGGDLAGRLAKAGQMLERAAALHRQVQTALTGPAITVLAGALILYGVTHFVMPRFLGLYDQMHLTMPLLSRVVIGLVKVANHPLTLLALALVAASVVVYREALAEKLFVLAVKVPVLNRWIGTVLCAELCDVLSGLHREGVPLHQALQMLVRTAPRKLHRSHLEGARRRLVLEGSISKAIAVVPYFPRTVVAMCEVGEESGSLDEMLASLSRLLEEQIQVVLAQVVTLLEPLVVCGIGVVTAVLFVGMFLPVYGVLNSLGG